MRNLIARIVRPRPKKIRTARMEAPLELGQWIGKGDELTITIDPTELALKRVHVVGLVVDQIEEL